jgi:TolB-like protein/DNA-binding winged helix-turn-helix (wHTH) protein/Flp pilus assembly protein TadD
MLKSLKITRTAEDEDMDRAAPNPKTARFGLFEVNFEQRILTKDGLRIKLQDQPFAVLEMLLNHPGELVTREEIRKRLWPADTFVEFDASLNTAIKKLRIALSDAADNPRFIETVPRRGYRFLAPITTQTLVRQTGLARTQRFLPSDPASEIESTRSEVVQFPRTQRLTTWALAGSLLTAFTLVLIAWAMLHARRLPRDAEKKFSLVVLPLEDLSPDHSEEYLSEGLTDELITDLAKIPGFRIISRTSTMQYKGTNKSLSQIGRELNVNTLVEGTILRSGNRVRVRVQLIQANTDEHLWAEAYERDTNDVLALQSDIARSIAAQIKLELTPQQQAGVSGTRPVSFDAYAAYLKGRYEWNKRTAESLKKSIEYFQESIERDPGYGNAHEGLAETYSVLPDYDVMTPGEAYAKAKAEALKATELDPSLGEAHATLAVVKQELDWDWAGAESEFQIALKLNPGSATTHQWYSEYSLRVGRIPEAIDQLRQALELDPASPLMNAELGSVLYSARQYDEAIQQLKKAIDMEPSFPYAHSWLGFAYEQKGMRQEAIAEFHKAVALSGGSPFFRAALAYGYGLAGNETEARKISGELTRLSRSQQFYVSPYDFALVHVGLGEREQALNSLEQVVATHDIASDLLKIEPSLDPVRSDRRFDLLVRRVGLAH